MTTTGLEAFDTTVHKTNTWLKEVMNELGWDNEQKAYLALRATLHALRDRLTVDEVAQLGAQLPMLMRGLYYEGWDPTGKPVKERHRSQFLERVMRPFQADESVDPERVTRAVFAVLSRRVTSGEIEDVKHVLPAEIRELWPSVESSTAAWGRSSVPAVGAVARGQRQSRITTRLVPARRARHGNEQQAVRRVDNSHQH
jgi:uncharacterized protein (DUF2267 family)